MPKTSQDPTLSIIVNVVSGRDALSKCLAGFYRQAVEIGAEIIVPCDFWSQDVKQLSAQFPEVNFVEFDLPDEFTQPGFGPARHILYDLRRAAGLTEARGYLIALTEDHAVPGEDWCRKIIQLHDEMKNTAAIGGAIDNAVDTPLNWAQYYCDFGRYGSPVKSGPVEYLSDVNISYKRKAILAMRDLWKSGYHETTVHWEMCRTGAELYLDTRLVVFQHRPKSSVTSALRERIEWGKTFAKTRACETNLIARALLGIGCTVLPFLLLQRAVKNMLRQGRTRYQIVQIAPVTFLLVAVWSVGEAIGYLSPITEDSFAIEVPAEASISETT